jgi:predicted metal-dependent phosphoesterase TrpH
MTTRRLASVALLAAAVVAGTIGDRPHRPDPITLGGYRVLAVDFHTHSSMWSDGALTPWGLVLEAERQGLDAIAITGHNEVFDGQLGQRFSRAVGGPIVIAGEEILGHGDQYHMIAAGIRDVVSFRQDAASAIDQIHQQGGIAIAAHPFPDFSAGWDGEAVMKLDGAEICHPGIFGRGNQRDLERFAARAPMAAIGSSDFHGLGQMGLCRTYVFATDDSERAILDAVRARRTIVFGEGGHAYGDPALLQYADRLRDRAPASDSRGGSLDWFSRLAGVAGLAGLFCW